MALTRKFLSALGIDADKVDEIISAHTETVNALKEQRDSYKDDAEKLSDVQAKLDDANKTIDTMKKEQSGDDKWKVKYDALKEDFDTFKSELAEKETKAQKESAVMALLKEIGVAEKRINAVMKVTDLSEIELEDGNIKDVDTLKESLRTEWSDFIETKGEEGAKTPTPPDPSGGNTFEQMSVAEKMIYANEHPNDSMVREWLNK